MTFLVVMTATNVVIIGPRHHFDIKPAFEISRDDGHMTYIHFYHVTIWNKISFENSISLHQFPRVEINDDLRLVPVVQKFKASLGSSNFSQKIKG